MNKEELINSVSHAFELLGNPLRMQIFLRILEQGCDCNIDEQEGTTVSQAAALLGLKSTSLSRMLNQLEKSGLIYRESNQGDKRSVKIYLTELGKEKRHLARVVVQQFNNYLNKHISEHDKQYLIELMKKINKLTINYKPEQS